jgi:triacylglycerol lipase
MKPIVLAHGYLGFGTLGFKTSGFGDFAQIDYFRKIPAYLKSRYQVEVYSSSVGPKDSVEERSADLKREIASKFPGQPVHIIAHSMGGLDARYLLLPKAGEKHDYIASLTTVSTPHQGTYLAEIALMAGTPRDLLKDSKFQDVLDRLKSSLMGLGALFEPALAAVGQGNAGPFASYVKQLFGVGDRALPDLTEAGCKRLFGKEPATSETACFSYAASAVPFRSLAPALGLSHLILEAADGPNDGVVSVHSAKWRSVKDVFPADHMGVIGWGAKKYLPWYDEIVENIQSNVPNA